MADTIKLSVEFPESLVAGLWIDEATASEKMKEAVVLDLFRQKRISIRKGAELLGLSYREFLDILSRRQVPITDYGEGEIDCDLEAFKVAHQESDYDSGSA